MKTKYVAEESNLLNDGWEKDYSNEKYIVSMSNNGTELKIKAEKIDKNISHMYAYYNSNKVKDMLIKQVKPLSTCQIALEGTVEGNLQIHLIIIGYNEKGSKILNETIGLDFYKNFQLPKNISKLQMAFRISGEGEASITCLKFKIFHVSDHLLSENLIHENSLGDYLIISNVYPEKNNLYRNMFVHRRAQLYESSQVPMDIFRFTASEKNLRLYKFEGSMVINGDKGQLINLLKMKKYKKILIHFVNQEMIEAIEESGINIPIIIWIHGVETEKWYRRWFNFMGSSDQLLSALQNVEKNKKIVNFMRSLYQSQTLDVKFIFVSKWFKEAVAENDTNTVINNYEIIHNVIDESIFSYVEKDIEQRKKILSIRPYASRKYANDLTVKAILELSKKPYFNELEFKLFGEGPLFNSTLEPIRKFDNVKIYNYFLSQDEIAKLHKENGVFMCPTRLDSQGVSMCEAMSSGLIPITNGVTAIPEFVDEKCGYLARKENYMDMVDAVEDLYLNPEKFKQKSQNAALRMSNQCSKNIVIKQELDVITS